MVHYYKLRPLLTLLFLSVFVSSKAQDIEYSLSMPEPHTHYFEVEMKVSNLDKSEKLKGKKIIEFKLPVWTPGSYLIREYAKNVEGFEAFADKKLKSYKTSKNTWTVETNGKNSVSLKYRVYAFELTVRTSFLDDTHGYLNGGNVFMYVPELMNQPSSIKINPYKGWTSVSTGLEKISATEFIYSAPNYDMVVDSPIEIGTHKELSFTEMGVPHKIAMYSNTKLEYDEQTVIDAYKKVVRAATDVVGEHPCKNYTFIVHHLPNIGGGLEHLNSTTCQTSTSAYASDAAFKGFMGLIAHEYFHLWNVKRIRPIALGPFDYEKENYTNMLWVSEGITNYYEDNLLRKAGMISESEYQTQLLAGIIGIENAPGQRVQSVADASWDAWIKFYRPNENSNNSTISYYNKGGVLGNLLNMYVISETKGKKTIDDIFKVLWNEYYKKLDRGYTDEEFKKVCESVTGSNMDFFFDNYIYDTKPIDYNSFFEKFGTELVNENANTKTPYFGANLRGTMVASVTRGSGAYNGGINVNDEIVEVDGKKNVTISAYVSGKNIGDVINVTVKRSGQLFTYPITITANPSVKYVIKKKDNISKTQQMLYDKWMMN